MRLNSISTFLILSQFCEHILIFILSSTPPSSSFKPHQQTTYFPPNVLHISAVPFTQNWGHAGLQSFSQYLPTTAAVSVSSRAAALLHSAIGLA
jgi:hypothetical protein